MVSVIVVWLWLKQERVANLFKNLPLSNFTKFCSAVLGLLHADGQEWRSHYLENVLVTAALKTDFSIGGLPNEKVNCLKNKYPPRASNSFHECHTRSYPEKLIHWMWRKKGRVCGMENAYTANKKSSYCCVSFFRFGRKLMGAALFMRFTAKNKRCFLHTPYR